ncbi:GFA family protein [Candidatus Peregrinibacteria bacterium]|nr:GFA family protein [Candidatus Peregrinibacteria bacterium]
MKTYKGSCHCGAVQYEVDTDLARVIDCNCSHCHMKGLVLNFVDQEKFRLTKGEDQLTSYQFNTKGIDHLFCKNCGTQSFAKGITFPQVGINVRCLEGVDISKLTLEHYNGKDI